MISTFVAYGSVLFIYLRVLVIISFRLVAVLFFLAYSVPSKAVAAHHTLSALLKCDDDKFAIHSVV